MQTNIIQDLAAVSFVKFSHPYTYLDLSGHLIDEILQIKKQTKINSSLPLNRKKNPFKFEIFNWEIYKVGILSMIFNIGTDSTIRLQKRFQLVLFGSGSFWQWFCVLLQSQFWLARGLKQPQPGLAVYIFPGRRKSLSWSGKGKALTFCSRGQGWRWFLMDARQRHCRDGGLASRANTRLWRSTRAWAYGWGSWPGTGSSSLGGR